MGSLKRAPNGGSVTLRGRTLAGRSTRADLKLAGDGVSSEHASIYWDGTHWVLRDLKSRNGTRLNGMLLLGRDCRLSPKDEIVFGDPAERWIWLESSAPEAFATREDGLRIPALDGILFLPDCDLPRATVHVREGQWQLDIDGNVRPAKDGETVELGEARFALSLPAVEPEHSRTHTLAASVPLSSARVVFKVSLDEEHVEVTFSVGELERSLSARAINYLLLELARTRCQDSSEQLSLEDAGWLYTDELAEHLGVTPEAINVDVYRLRHAVAKLQLFSDPEEIIQRRRSTAQLRLGLAEIEIQQASPLEPARRPSRKPRPR